MIRSLRRISGFTALVSILAGCGDGLEDRVLLLEGRGAVTGVIFLDLNGDSVFNESDQRLPDIVVSIAHPLAIQPIAVDTTETTGTFEMPSVPVGRIETRLHPSVLGDSLGLVNPDTLRVTLKAAATVNLPVGLSYPAVGVGEAGSQPLGSGLFTTGIVLTGRTPEEGGTVFLRGEGGALRIIGIPAGTGIFPGDSIRIRGRVAISLGRPVLQSAGIFQLSTSESPLPVSVTTNEAAGARSGTLDADLVQISNAAVTDTVTVAGDLMTTVDDGTGPLTVRLRGGLGFSFSTIRPGITTLTLAAGTLVPTNPAPGGAPRWALLPRTGSDLTITQATLAPELSESTPGF